MRLILVLLAALALSGCETLQAPMPLPNASVQKIHIDDRLLEPCASFEDIADNPQPSDVLDAHAKNVKVFVACKERHKALANTTRKIVNQQ